MAQPPYTGQVFEVQQCFDRIELGAVNYDLTYCIGEAVMLAATCVNLALLTLLTVWYMLAEGCCKLKTFSNGKTWIFFTCILFNCIVILRYLFANDFLDSLIPNLDSFLLVANQVVESICFLLLCYYFIEGTSQLLLDNKYIIIMLRVLMVTGLVLFSVYSYFEWSALHSTELLCKTLFFIIPRSVDIFINIVFIIVTCKLSSIFRKLKDNQLRMSVFDDTASRQDTQKSIKQRDEAICNTWIFVISLGLVQIYCLLYSLTLYLFTGQNCHFASTPVIVYSLTTIISRFIQDVIWVYLLLFHFWPHEHACLFCKGTSMRSRASNNVEDSEDQHEVDEVDRSYSGFDGETHAFAYLGAGSSKPSEHGPFIQTNDTRDKSDSDYVKKFLSGQAVGRDEGSSLWQAKEEEMHLSYPRDQIKSPQHLLTFSGQTQASKVSINEQF